VVSINVIPAAIGFVVGVILGMVAFALVLGERRANYRVMAARHPWLRLLHILWNVACGAAAGFIAYALAE